MRIKIHYTFGIYLLCIWLLSSCYACASVLITLLIHEFCHYAVGKAVGERIEQLELTPFGGVMIYHRGTISSKGIQGILVYSAGPFGNYALLFLISKCSNLQMLNPEFLRCLVISNTSMLVLNLLPALPLDGGRIAICIGYYFLPIGKLVSFLSASGVMIGLSGIALTVYGLITTRLFNCTLILISIYLIFSATQCKKTMYAENFYSLVFEQMRSSSLPKHVYHYLVDPQTRLLDLLPLLKQENYAYFLFDYGKEQNCTINETQYCQALLTSPASTIAQAYSDISNSKEKTMNSENEHFPS